MTPQPPDKAQPACSGCTGLTKEHADMGPGFTHSQPAKTEEKCPKCQGKRYVMHDQPGNLNAVPCECQNPSLELGPDTEVGKLGPGEMFDEGGMIYLRDLDEKYQQALLKGGLDREKVIRHLKEFNDIRSDYFDFHKEGSPAYKFYEGSEDAVNRIIEALESGALDVTTEPRKEVPQ